VTLSSDILVIGGMGYIGSALTAKLKNTNSIDLADSSTFDYNNLTEKQLSFYKTIILVAGHSSVGQCINDPAGAWNNNVSRFESLLRKINKQTFIYASSGSVYNNCANITEENRHFYLTNIYDLTKFTIDQLAKLSGKNYYGLRFGTVCGHAPIMRWDLMINKMYQSAGNGVIEVANPQITRPILGMGDLVRAIQAIIKDPKHPGIYNLKSFSKTIGEIGQEVALELGTDLETIDPAPAYDFNMDTTKFQETYNFMFKEDIKSIIRSLKYETIN